MNKKLNTVLFLIGGTVFNVIITIGSILGLSIIWGKFIMSHVPQSVQYVGFIVCIFGGAAIAFLLYRAVFKLITKKVDVEKYFDPLFKPRYRKH